MGEMVIDYIDGYDLVMKTGLLVDRPIVAKVAIEDGEIIAAGGLAWGGGRCWLWFSVEHEIYHQKISVVREARKMLKRAVQLGETIVYTIRDQSLPTSERLLRVVGFEFDSFVESDEVWKWQL